MAQTNYTPIQLYNSTTAAAAPIAANLANGELAINITDGKLYYKDNSGVVQVIATKGAGTIGGSTTQIQYNNAGALAGNAAMVFNSGTSTTTLTTLNLTNALGATYGGTAQSTYTQGDVLYSSAANTLAKLSIGAVNYILASTGSVPQWVAPSSIAVLTATNLAGGLAGSVPYQSALDTTTFLAIGAANRVMTSTGSAPQWVTSLTGLTGVSTTTLNATGSGTLTNLLFSAGTLPGAGTPSIALRSSDNIIYHQAGSANSIIFLDSVQNSMYIATATSHSFAISNVNKLTLNSTGLQVVNTLSGGTSGTAYSFSGSAPATSLTLDSSGNVGIGAAPSSEWTASGLLQITNSSIYSTFSLASTRTVADGNRIGSIVWDMPNNTATYRTRAEIRCDMKGSTANKFGGQVAIDVAKDNEASLTASARFNAFGIGLGASIPSSGMGITFPADQSILGASSDANTLDDYEEGTWTPSINFSTSNGFTLGTQLGTYTKVGRLVSATAYISFDKGTSVGDFSITGLPFTNINSIGGRNGIAFGFVQRAGRALYQMGGVVFENTTVISMILSSQTSAGTIVNLANTDIDANTATFSLSITYQTT